LVATRDGVDASTRRATRRSHRRERAVGRDARARDARASDRARDGPRARRTARHRGIG